MRRREMVYRIIFSLLIGILIFWILVFYVRLNEEQLVERFEREIKARTYDENVQKSIGLVTHMEDLLNEGLIGRTRDKSMEIVVILNAIDDEKADSEYENQLIESI